MSKKPRDQDDTKKQLEEQLGFLHSSCVSFDNGAESEYKRISLALRILLHNTGASHSLRKQLNLNNTFLDTSYYIPRMFVRPHEKGRLTDQKRLFAECSGGTRYYAPYFGRGPGKNLKIEFEEWWNQDIFSDAKGSSFSRKDLVTIIANQDGGAHIDPALNENYFDVTRNNSHGYIEFDNVEVDGQIKAANHRPRPAPIGTMIRQIGYEVLVSLAPLYGYDGSGKYDGAHIFGYWAVIGNENECTVWERRESSGYVHNHIEYGWSEFEYPQPIKEEFKFQAKAWSGIKEWRKSYAIVVDGVVTREND